MSIRHPNTISTLRTLVVGRVARSDARALATSASRRLPRAPVRAPAGPASSTAPAPIEPPAHSISREGSDPAASVSNGADEEPSPSDPPPPPPSFPSIVTSLSTPAPPASELSPEHHVLFNHLATSFIPGNQPCASEPLFPGAMMRGAPDGSVMVLGGESDTAAEQQDPVVALVCPFEGGDAYISRAVEEVASHLSADVVRLDLALGVGFDGPFAPLRETGISAPPLPQSINPLFQAPNRSGPPEAPMGEEMEGEDDDMSRFAARGGGHMAIPLMALGDAGGGGPFGPPGGHGRPAANEEWVSFFNSLINMQLPEEAAENATPTTRRIVLLESTAAMSETFAIWWPSFMEALRRRRRGVSTSASRGKGKGKAPARPTTTQPTTVVLSVPPSLLLPHTAEYGGEGLEAEEAKETIRSHLESLGARVAHVHIEGPAKSDENLWWSSEEHDHDGRRRREERRLRTLMDHGSLLPSFEQPEMAGGPGASPGHPLLKSLFSLMRKPKGGDADQAGGAYVWKTVPIIPANRDLELERHERTLRRRAVNAALMMRAVGELGATLEEPLSMLEAPGSAPWRGRKKRMRRRKEPDPEWSEAVIAWDDAVDLASTAVGNASAHSQSPKQHLVIKWQDIQDSRFLASEHERRIDDTVLRHLSTSQSPTAQRFVEHLKGNPQTPKQDAPQHRDPVVEQLKKTKLGKHEERLLACIVDSSKLASASFKDVHLPYKTIDAIRTVISLPLLFPDAFQGGILKDHTTSGALLFGPPGTGKTLLARAIAAESGARMLAIQPSDVNDMWVGEGEKLVKAVFSLARKLSPCVIFIDEVDSLFGARSARDSSGGAKAHNQILTEFMQEMDGLSSAIENRDKRIVVVGATNRPFDLDDAVLRRLPRRLLVDLPNQEDRKAILQILLRDEKTADDVDLDKIAARTEGFSGSDLKHLCVSAALAAVKETIDVPWKASVAPAAPKDDSSASDPPSHPPGEEERIAVEKTADEVKLGTPEVLPNVAESQRGPAAELSPAGKLVEEAHMRRLEEQELRAILAQRGEASPSATEPGKAGDETADPSQTAADQAAIDGVEASAEEEIKPLALHRVLKAKHFASALKEIRPSSSENTLPELRKWAEQYGEGGTKQGKKSGFGKGFGFGEEKQNLQTGFGRVEENNN